MPEKNTSQPRWLSRLVELESLVVPYFNYVAAVLALAVLVTVIIGEVSAKFEETIRPLYVAFTLLIVIEILRRVHSVNNRSGTETTKVAENQTEALETLTEYVKETSFRGEVQILLYAGSVIDQFLKQLITAKVKKIQLLTCDPACALNPKQVERIKSCTEQRQRTFRGAANVAAGFYRVPPSLRGIYLRNEMIAVGWYTYESALAEGRCPRGKDLDLHGPSNAMVIMDARTSDGRTVAEFFERTFSQLWNDSSLQDRGQAVR